MPGKVVTVIFPSPYPDNKSTFGASSYTMPSDIEVVIPGMSDHLSLHRSILRARSSALNEILGRKNAREVRYRGWPRRAVGTLAVADSQDGLMLIMVLRFCYGVDLRLTPEEILVMFRCPDSDSEDSNWEALAGWTKKVLIRGNIQRNRAEVLVKLAFAVSECLEVIDEQELEEEEERQRALTGEKRKKEMSQSNQTRRTQELCTSIKIVGEDQQRRSEDFHPQTCLNLVFNFSSLWMMSAPSVTQ